MTERRLSCPPALDRDSGRDLFASVEKSSLSKGVDVVLDLNDTKTVDSLGGAWIVKIADQVRCAGGGFRWEGANAKVEEFLNLLRPTLERGPEKKRRASPMIDAFTEYLYGFFRETRAMTNLVFDAVYWSAVAPLEGRGFRWGLLLDEMHEMGVRAVPINFLMNFLLGFTIAVLSAAQIEGMGLGILVTHLVFIGFARELASLMTAVIVSARTGAAITAELATMKVQEEIDALRGMGLHVAQFLVAPKLVAMVLVMPCLFAIGLFAGVLGGSVWGIFGMGFRAEVWYNETWSVADLRDVYQGFAKCILFAVTIVLVGCHNGLRVTGGSRGVGLMTTRSVVMDIFFIISIDMVFATIFYYIL